MKTLYRNTGLDRVMLICAVLLLAFGSMGFGFGTHKKAAEAGFNALPDDIKDNLSLDIILY